MLLYPLATRSARTWLLDLTGPLTPPDRPSVYALVVPVSPPRIYIGATQHLAQRVHQHLSRSKSEWRRGRGRKCPPRTAAAAVLAPVFAGRSGLLVIRLEAVPPGNETLLRRLELAWLIVAAREELPEQRRRGPRLQWSGDPGELRQAYQLARTRRWPEQWIRALRPLCDNRALPDRPVRRRRPRGPADAPAARRAPRPAAPEPAGREAVPAREPGPARPALCAEAANGAPLRGAGGPPSKIGSQRQNRGRRAPRPRRPGDAGGAGGPGGPGGGRA